YPFFQEGRILRVATIEDLNAQSAIESRKHEHVRRAREAAERLRLPLKVVDAEELLGGERITFYFTATQDEHARVDFRPLVMDLAQVYRTRVEMRQIGARDEARLVADYEKCGQHCCCKQFLKVLKPVSMKQAKIQKATLDPLKISGRCGRLMCCLRYEETTYDDLKKRLPKKKTRVMTPDGPGLVLDSQILTQLVLVLLDSTNESAAYPLENLDLNPPPTPPARPSPAAHPPGTAEAPGEDDEAPPGDAGPGPSPRGPAPARRPQPPGQPHGQHPRGPHQGPPQRSGDRGQPRPGGPPPPGNRPPGNQPRGHQPPPNQPPRDRGPTAPRNFGGGPPPPPHGPQPQGPRPPRNFGGDPQRPANQQRPDQPPRAGDASSPPPPPPPPPPSSAGPQPEGGQ
ncbi:MAG: hypothetical protein JNK35_01545, partial [Phycisphaerae bacterium]|nr:hypothetical protein [Phycisphaerae bacterium]